MNTRMSQDHFNADMIVLRGATCCPSLKFANSEALNPFFRHSLSKLKNEISGEMAIDINNLFLIMLIIHNKK